MKYFHKKHKFVAWILLLTFLFTGIMPTNMMAGNNTAEAETPSVVPVSVIITDDIKMTLHNIAKEADIQKPLIGGGYKGPDGKEGRVKQGLVKPLLENGYPSRTSDGGSLDYLFANGTPVTGLFLKTYYEDTGYYHYSCFENAAVLEGNTLQAYNALMAPRGNAYFNKRGNFLPYDSFETATISTSQRNYYDGDGQPLEKSAKRYGEAIYVPEKHDEYFALTLEADFVQLKNGQVANPKTGALSDMVFRFNGDDDVWVFIDDVLVLDLGGSHDAHSGSINFATGAVEVKDSYSVRKSGQLVPSGEIISIRTNIAEQFRTAGKYDADNFNGNTFADYTKHTMKIFYMDRGSASNLELEFNLPTYSGNPGLMKIVEGVNEELTNPDAEFGFTLDVADSEAGEQRTPYTGIATVLDGNNKNQITIAQNEKVRLKHHGIAAFNVEGGKFVRVSEDQPENTITDYRIDRFKSDGSTETVLPRTAWTGPEDAAWYKIDAAEESKLFFTFYNSVPTGDLSITKQMAEGEQSDAEFRFQVYLKNDVPAGSLIKSLPDWTLYQGDGEGTITLRSGETKTIADIPVGTEYKIVELPIPGYGLQSATANEVPLAITEEQDASGAEIAWVTGRMEATEVPEDAEDVSDSATSNDVAVVLVNTGNGNIRFAKTDAEGNPLPGAVFGLFEGVDGVEADENVSALTKPIKEAQSDAEGMVSFTGVQPGDYRVKEIKAPIGYELNNTIYPVTVVANKTSGISEDPDENRIVNQLVTTDFTFTKQYESEDGEPDEKATFHVTTEDREFAPEILVGDDGKYTMHHLKYGYVYRVEENAPKGYQPVSFEVTVDADGNAKATDTTRNPVEGCTYLRTTAEGTVVTNYRTQENFRIGGKKVWDDNKNAGNTRPAFVTIQLTRDDGKVETKEVTGGEFVFNNLERYNVVTGHKYQYSIKEIHVPEGYTPSYRQSKVNGNPYITITNTLGKEEFVNIDVTKKWEAIPSDVIVPDHVIVNVFAKDASAGDRLVAFARVTGEDGWKHTFDKLPRYSTSGTAITYTVQEVPVAGYTVSYENAIDQETGESNPYSFIVTNTYRYNRDLKGDIVVTKEVTGSGTPDDDQTYGFVLSISATESNWTPEKEAKAQVLKETIEKAKKTLSEAKERLAKALDTFRLSEHTYVTTAGAYRFVVTYSDEEQENVAIYAVTSPSALDWDITTPAGLVWFLDEEEAFTPAKKGSADSSFLDEFLAVVRKLAGSYSSLYNVTGFLHELSAATSSSALVFDLGELAEVVESQSAVNGYQGWVERSEQELENFMVQDVTTPSVIKLVIHQAGEADRVVTFTPDQLGDNKQYNFDFNLKNKGTISFDIEATTGSTISYTINEQILPEQNHIYYTGTDITVVKNGEKKVVSDNRVYSQSGVKAKDLTQVNVTYTNKYYKAQPVPPVPPDPDPDPTPTPTPTPDPEKETVIPTEVMDDAEVPQGEPGFEIVIDDPDNPLGDAPQTGDAANAAGMMALLAMAGVCLLITRKRFN